jgi:DNA-binding NarL/FixJ family response regulator
MNVLLIDDHQLVLEALAELINRKVETLKVFKASAKEEALQMLNSLQDLGAVICDLNFGGKLEGFSILRQVIENNPSLPCVVLSMHSEEALIGKALSLGARGFVVKNDPPEEIFAAIQSVLLGETYLSKSAREASRASGLPVALSVREQEIAELVATGSSSKVIGERLGISHRTVEVHRQNIMKKLNVQNAAQLVNVLRQMNLV